MNFGYFSKQWIIKKSEYMNQMNLDNLSNQALTGIKIIIQAFWEFTKEVWEVRNLQLHQETEEPLNFKKIQLLRDVEILYSKANQMLYNDRDVFTYS